MSDKDRYLRAYPLPHLVLDDAVDHDMLYTAFNAWPASDAPEWESFDAEHERKQQMQSPPGPELWAVLNHLTSVEFTRTVETVTGIPELIPDLLGGGLHESGPGAYLDVHTDFNIHPAGWYRRVNVLLFANHAWQPEYGGALVLQAGKRRVAIGPRWNRLVMFETNATSWHGHPQPWAGPHPRRSFAVYFYTVEPPPNAEEPRGTTWYEEITGRRVPGS